MYQNNVAKSGLAGSHAGDTLSLAREYLLSDKWIAQATGFQWAEGRRAVHDKCSRKSTKQERKHLARYAGTRC